MLNPIARRITYWNVLGCVGLAMVMAVGFNGCSRSQDRNEAQADQSRGNDPLVRVTPIRPTRETLVRYTDQPGHVSALEETPIFAKLPGYVRRVHVDIGEQVKGPIYKDGRLIEPGQTLIELEVPELERELAQKEAAVEHAKSVIKQSEAAIRVAEAMKSSSDADLQKAHAMVERVDAERDRWKSELDRMTDLASRQAITPKLVDETQSKFRASDAARKEIAATIRSAEAHRDESVALVEKAIADSEAAAASRDVARADQDRIAALLRYTTIVAPFDGVVAARNVDTGHLVSSNFSSKEPLLVVVRAETVRVFVDVPEVDAVFIQPGTESALRFPSLGADDMLGTVTRTGWVLNEATRTLRAEIDVPNEENRLRPGMYVNARLKVAEKKDALVIPKTAVLKDAGKTYCWLIEKTTGKLIKHPLRIGLEASGKLEVLSGLDGSESIIGVNPAAFREGQQVEVVAATK